MDKFRIDENLTHEQKVRLALWDIKVDIRNGWIFICSFIIVLIIVLVSPSSMRSLYMIIFSLGLLCVWIVHSMADKKVNEISEKAVDYFHYKNRRRRKK